MKAKTSTKTTRKASSSVKTAKTVKKSRPKRAAQKRSQPAPQAKGRTYSDRIMIEALKKSAGLITHAAAALGCERSTVHRRIKASKAVADALTEIEDVNLDRAEAKLAQAINNGNLTAVIFYLKTKGKQRGYSERVDVTAEHNHEHQHTHSVDDSAAEFDSRLDQFFARIGTSRGVDETSPGSGSTH